MKRILIRPARRATQSLAVALMLVVACACTPSSIDDVYIHTNSDVNRSVGQHLVLGAQEIAAQQLCVSDDLQFYIRDVGATRSSEGSKLGWWSSGRLAMNWLFESNLVRDNDPEISDQERFEFYTRPNSPNYILRHELGHIIFSELVSVSKRGRNEYASGSPDWLDEGVAVVFENGYMRAKRREELLEHYSNGYLFTVSSLLSLPHPSRYVQRSAPALIVSQGKLAEQTPTNDGGQNPPDQLLAWFVTRNGERFEKAIEQSDIYLFYAQSHAYLEYLTSFVAEECAISIVTQLFDQDSNVAPEHIAADLIGASHLIPQELDIAFADWLDSNMSKSNNPSVVNQ